MPATIMTFRLNLTKKPFLQAIRPPLLIWPRLRSREPKRADGEECRSQVPIHQPGIRFCGGALLKVIFTSVEDMKSMDHIWPSSELNWTVTFRGQGDMGTWVFEVTEFKSEARSDLWGCLEATKAYEATSIWTSIFLALVNYRAIALLLWARK